MLPILEEKYELGLFDHPYVDESKVEATLNRPEGLVLERKLAGRSMVLLKNENDTLPLKKTVRKVAVIGPLADSIADIEGGWTVEGSVWRRQKSHPVTVLAGIKNKLGPDAQVTLVAGPEPSRIYPVTVGPDGGKEADSAADSRRDSRLACEGKGCGRGCGCGGRGAG